MFKKQLIVLSALLLISMTAFSQKKELRAAEKALKKGNYSTILSTIAPIEGLIDAAPAKLKAKYYYLKAKALFADGTNTDNNEAVVSALNSVIEIESKGSKKYSVDSQIIVNGIIDVLRKEATSYIKSAETNSDLEGYNKGAEGLYKVYQMQKNDTTLLYYAGYYAYFGAGYKKSLERFQKLSDMGYTGIYKTFKATSKVTGEDKYYNSEADMNTEVKLKIADNPVIDIIKSKANEIIKYIALNYVALGENENALTAIAKAREASPKDYDLIVNEANIYYKMGNNEMFISKLEEAIKLNPTNAELHYNIGTLSMEANNYEKAKRHLLKAVELDPKYYEAYNNLGSLVLKSLESIEKEMNDNAMNFAKYDEIKNNKWKPILKKALPFLEKSYQLKPTDFTKNQLNSMYENLEMETRVK